MRSAKEWADEFGRKTGWCSTRATVEAMARDIQRDAMVAMRESCAKDIDVVVRLGLVPPDAADIVRGTDIDAMIQEAGDGS